MRFAQGHYIVLARALRHALKKAHTPREKRGILHAYDAICDELQRDNSNFSNLKFAEATFKDEKGGENR